MNSASLIFPSLSALYGAATQARLAAYRRGILSVARLNAPVISVGNITTGGTGKSPLVEWVCRRIAREGKKICILTRGYRRANSSGEVLVSDGAEVIASAAHAGDEPLMLAERLKGLAAVISNADRLAAGKWAIENLGSEVFVLDDGFQHLRLFRDLNVVLIDATNPWGGNNLLPSGRLRESPGGLSRADCVVITRSEQAEHLDSLRAEIVRFSSGRPIVISRTQTSGVRRLNSLLPGRPGPTNDDPKLYEAGSIPRPTGAFCGVGNPQSFFRHLQREGLDLAFMRHFSDHHNYTQADLDSLVSDSTARNVKSLITTAKDAVKLASLRLEMPCYVFDVEIVIDDEKAFVEMIRHAVTHHTSQKA